MWRIAARLQRPRAAFRGFSIAKGTERPTGRVAYYAPKVGVEPRGIKVMPDFAEPKEWLRKNGAGLDL